MDGRPRELGPTQTFAVDLELLMPARRGVGARRVELLVGRERLYQCRGCTVWYPPDQFSALGGKSRSGRASECRRCMSIRRIERAARDKPIQPPAPRGPGVGPGAGGRSSRQEVRT